jgi:hypothetical protein
MPKLLCLKCTTINPVDEKIPDLELCGNPKTKYDSCVVVNVRNPRLAIAAPRTRELLMYVIRLN